MLYASSSQEIEGGEYTKSSGFKSMRVYPEKQEVSEKAERLWNQSEELTGLIYPDPT